MRSHLRITWNGGLSGRTRECASGVVNLVLRRYTTLHTGGSSLDSGAATGNFEMASSWSAIPLFLAIGLAGCTKEGVLCSQGLTPCGAQCFDLTSDSQHCGSCGISCGARQVCQGMQCQCQGGATACGSACVDVQTDPGNCGGCAGADAGAVCGAAQVCDRGQCRAGCALPGYTVCGQSCVDQGADPNHCGDCYHACANAQSCHRGICTYDVVAACFNTGQVVGIQGETDFKGPVAPVGSFPQALGALDDVLLAADGIDQKVREARLGDFSLLPDSTQAGSSPNHLWVDDPYIYVANSLGNTLQVLRRNVAASDADAGLSLAPDGGVVHRFVDGGLYPSGLGLTTVGEISLGAQSSPQAIVKLNQDLFIPLYSGQVARVQVLDPTHPQLVAIYDLNALNLKSFDGGATFTRPSAITAFQGNIYVALSNLDVNYSPGGPGALAKINALTGAMSSIDLGADVCLNAFWIGAQGDSLYVSCEGRVVYDSSYNPQSVEKSGMVQLDALDHRVAAWNVSCGAASNGGCLPPSVGRFAIFQGTRLYLTDQSAGRVFVVEAINQQLIERRGYNAQDGGPPILACPSASSISLVSDAIAIP